MSLKKSVICIDCHHFNQDGRITKQAQSLHHAGADVSVIAIYTPSLPEKETLPPSIPVIRLKLFFHRFANYRWLRPLMLTEFLLTVAWKFRKKDIFFCNDLHALPIGIFTKLFLNRKLKVVYDAHEYETERHGTKNWMKPFLRWFEKRLVRRADHVITVSESIAQEYVRLYNIPKPTLILNCPPFHAQLSSNLFRERLGIRSDQTIFLYQGGFSKGRGIELLIETFSNLDSDKNVIVFMGFGELEPKIKEAAERFSTLFFHEAASRETLLEHTSSADVGILPYEDTCLNHRFCSPNKIFEYFMAGIPVIVSNLVEMKRLVESLEVGVVAEENTLQGFRDAVAKIQTLDYEVLRSNVDKARREYHWENQEKKLIALYHALF